MPATPMAEQIEVEVETRLNEMSTANGYNYDYKNNGPGEDLRFVEGIEQRNEFPVVFCPPGNEGPPEERTAGTRQTSRNERRLEIDIIGYAKSSDHGTQLNKIRQDVEKALIKPTDTQPLGIQGVTSLEPTTVVKDQFPDMPHLEIIIISLAAQYRYTRGDP